MKPYYCPVHEQLFITSTCLYCLPIQAQENT